MGFRFLQTGDWQLGMTRHYFSEGTQERYSQARFDAIRTMGQIAEQEQCQFMLVCGDVFESNQISRGTVARALEALKEVRVPVYIVPGNHDPLNAASVYDSSVFREKKSENVHVIRDAMPVQPVEGLDLVGAPWLSKRPAANPATEVLSSLDKAEIPRILAAHGGMDIFTPDKEVPQILLVAELENAIRDGKLQYIAVGDRHSATRIGSSDRIWYAGTPEATGTDEINSGVALVVDIDDNDARVSEVPVGKWAYIRKQANLDSEEDVRNLGDWLTGLEKKESTVLKLDLTGSLALTPNSIYEDEIASARDVFASVIVKDDDLLVVPDDEDFTELGFSGFADRTVDRLREEITSEGPDAGPAKDALMLMLRLSRSGE